MGACGIPLLFIDGFRSRKEYLLDANTLFTLLGSYCFPIVMCIYLTWFLNDEKKCHKSEMESLRGTLEDNTKILTELKTLFEVVKNG